MFRSITFVLIALFALPSSGQAAVLCLGADGHITFELAVGGRCCPETPERLETSLLQVPASDAQPDCGLCVDIEVGKTSSIQLYTRALELTFTAHLSDPVPTSAPIFADAPILLPRCPKFVSNSPLSQIRTVTILV